MKKIVTKFGGSSLADAGQFRKVKDIIALDEGRIYCVPSAPGKRCKTDTKVTDLLYRLHRQANEKDQAAFDETWQTITERYVSIRDELGLSFPIEEKLAVVREDVLAGASSDYAASRGEFLNGMLLADFLGWRFMDAAKVIYFDEDGVFNSEKTNVVMMALLADEIPTVVPGFYGAKPDGSVHTFSRGGSDITGAIVARAVGADTYENWTDVSGFLMADPRIVENPREISSITYAELRELSYMGASVLHEDAMFPVHKVGIPTLIRNTNNPAHPGTVISLTAPYDAKTPIITGVAGHKGFSAISIEKAMMNSELGFGMRVLQILADYGISFEHMPSGIDNLSVLVSSDTLAPHREDVVRRIADLTSPDSLRIHDHLGLIATVGRGMVSNRGTAARLFSAMSRAGVNIRMIDQGSSELSIIVAVDECDFEKTIEAIYNEFVG